MKWLQKSTNVHLWQIIFKCNKSNGELTGRYFKYHLRRDSSCYYLFIYLSYYATVKSRKLHKINFLRPTEKTKASPKLLWQLIIRYFLIRYLIGNNLTIYEHGQY